jgi:uncharacterized protein YidB (DUF937 family)
MGLLDGLLGSVLSGGGQQQQQGGGGAQQMLLQAALGMMQQKGGLTGVLDAFKQNGMGDHAASWVGTGENQGLSIEQLTKALGPGAIAAIAEKAGMSHGEAGSGLAAMLPGIINQMTPQGNVPDNHNSLLQDALGALAGGMLKK